MAGDAFAAEKPFEIKIIGRTAATYTVTPDDGGGSVIVDLIVESAQPVGLLGGYDANDSGNFDDGGDVADPGVVKVTAIDKNGFVLTQGATADIGTTLGLLQ